MKHTRPGNRPWWITVYSKEGERTFFFYATLVMFIVYGAMRLFGG